MERALRDSEGIGLSLDDETAHLVATQLKEQDFQEMMREKTSDICPEEHRRPKVFAPPRQDAREELRRRTSES